MRLRNGSTPTSPAKHERIAARARFRHFVDALHTGAVADLNFWSLAIVHEHGK
jgi:hypothetical protein